MMTTCRVPWCIALARPDGACCTVHAHHGERVHPAILNPGDNPSPQCEECEGSGECRDCDGFGTHDCDHANCFESHECPTCDGSGECQECSGCESDYLAWAFDAGWQPFQIIQHPWDGAGAERKDGAA